MLEIKQEKSPISLEYWFIFMTSIIMALILSLICIKVNSVFLIKPDTFLLVFGNLGIAYWIASVINKKHKSDELKMNRAFEELDALLKLIFEIKELIPQENFNDDESYRLMSLINLQIDLICKYSFIRKEDNNELINKYNKLNVMLTGSNKIDENYKLILLTIEKRILVIKSNILN